MTYSEQREELLESIEHDQEEALEAVHELTQAARETFSLSDNIRDNPLLWLAGCFALGIWLGRRTSVRPQILLATKGDLRP